MIKNYTLLFFILFLGKSLEAQITNVEKELKRFVLQIPDTLNGWMDDGNLNINMNQTTYSNWQSGGSNNVAGTVRVYKRYNYKRNKLLWANQIYLAYGLSAIKGKKPKKTDDNITLRTTIGGQFSNAWTISFFTDIQTQFSNTYNYSKDEGHEYQTSGFLSPLYVALGPGVLWKKNKNLYFNMAPFSFKTIFLLDEVYDYNSGLGAFISSNDKELYGVEPGRKAHLKIGYYSAAYWKTHLSDKIYLVNSLSFYTNYLENGQNVDVDYTLNSNFKINDILSTQLMFQFRYDDDAFAGAQFREALGVGMNIEI